jgi:hypothetical protein
LLSSLHHTATPHHAGIANNAASLSTLSLLRHFKQWLRPSLLHCCRHYRHYAIISFS